MTGRKSAHTSSKTLKIHKVFPAAFSSSGRLSASSKLLEPDSDGFSCDFWLLRRRCVVTHQDEKARPSSRTPSKAQRSGFVRKKEEGESIMEFLSKNKNEMARTSLLPRPPSKAQRSGFARKKEEGESIMEFSPQGGNGMARTSSDAVRRVCSCQPRVLCPFYTRLILE